MTPKVLAGLVVFAVGACGVIAYLWWRLSQAKSAARIASAELVITKALSRDDLDRVMTANEAKTKTAADALASAAQQAIDADAKLKTEDANALDADLSARGFR